MEPTYVCIRKDNRMKWEKMIVFLYIGRRMPGFMTSGLGPLLPSKWGNPFKVGRDGTIETVLTKYELYIRGTKELNDSISELTGETLGCWCRDQSECHSSILIKLWKEWKYGKPFRELGKYKK